jgi:hypothetical protein
MNWFEAQLHRLAQRGLLCPDYDIESLETGIMQQAGSLDKTPSYWRKIVEERVVLKTHISEIL